VWCARMHVQVNVQNGAHECAHVLTYMHVDVCGVHVLVLAHEHESAHVSSGDVRKVDR
jgi:hypothetical protein